MWFCILVGGLHQEFREVCYDLSCLVLKRAMTGFFKFGEIRKKSESCCIFEIGKGIGYLGSM